MTKWEYLFVKCEKDGNLWKPRNINNNDVDDWAHQKTDLVAFANQKGADGWELVSTMVDSMPAFGLGMRETRETAYRLIFKRPMP